MRQQSLFYKQNIQIGLPIKLPTKLSNFKIGFQSLCITQQSYVSLTLLNNIGGGFYLELAY